MCGFIAQLVEQRTGNAEVTGSNPVEALIFFLSFFTLRILFAAKHSWTALRMSGPLFVGSYLTQQQQFIQFANNLGLCLGLPSLPY